MIRIYIIAAILALNGCTMGTRYYLPDGRGGSHLAVVQSADMTGDQKVIITPKSITFILTTPTSNGAIVYRQGAVLNASKTAALAIVTEPVVAESSTSRPVRAAGEATAKGLQSAGTMIGASVTAIGAAKIIP